MTDHYYKATRLAEINNAVRFDVPVGPDHPFFTEFAGVRYEFDEKVIYRELDIDAKTFEFNQGVNRANKSLIFLAGMRGSGKTTELNKIVAKLEGRNAFFPVFCQMDDAANGLDMNDTEYMDILIFQIERLMATLQERKVDVKVDVLDDLQSWFREKVEEINTSIKREGGFEIKAGGATPSLLSFLQLSAGLKGSLMANKETATKIRSVFKENFTAFAQRTNLFLERVNAQIRRENKGQEILFIIDGLEKVAGADKRNRIIDGESDRIRQIKANTIFTLPIEMFALEPKLRTFSTIINFPFVKIRERTGERVPAAIAVFRDFILRRIDESLFESEEVIEKAICYGGGSPRELLRVLEHAYLYAEDDDTVLTKTALKKGVRKLSAEYTRRLDKATIEQLKLLRERNAKGLPTLYDESWQKMMEEITVLEYNDGTYKRVNPLIEASEIYRIYVLEEQL